jgi:hypothetical protein
MKLNERHHFIKLGLIVVFCACVCGLFYYSGRIAQAQEQKVQTMRCTPIQLSGMQIYDVNQKKIVPERRQVVINRCEGEDVVCFHSFDQSGMLSCIKK